MSGYLIFTTTTTACLLELARQIEGGLLVGVDRTIDFGDCLYNIGIVGNTDLGDCLSIIRIIVRTVTAETIYVGDGL